MVTKTCMIGVGGMARHHVKRMLELDTEIIVVSDPSEEAYQAFCEIFTEQNLTPPPNEPDLEVLLKQYAGQVDTAFIITPHVFHFEQTKACLEAGLDVLLEKPMVMNALEARELIKVRDESGKLLVIAFQGGLSPQIRKASQVLRSGELGTMLNISGTVWQNWKNLSAGTWRVVPHLAGGGFMFDTGAHMLNTICDLVGEDFVQVVAWQDNRGMDVDIIGAVMGRTESGVFVTINACGETAKSCHSDIRVFCTDGIIQTGQWGERLLIQASGEESLEPVDLPPMEGAWEQFLGVRKGEIENPCPPEVGLRMAVLWDAIRESASQGGVPVDCKTLEVIQ